MAFLRCVYQVRKQMDSVVDFCYFFYNLLIMKVAFLSDIHANFPALCAALKRIDRLKVDTIVVAGDIIGRGPHPVEVIRLLRKRDVIRDPGQCREQAVRAPFQRQKIQDRKGIHGCPTGLDGPSTDQSRVELSGEPASAAGAQVEWIQHTGCAWGPYIG